MAESFSDMPEALASTLEIAERCDTTIALKQQLIPRFDCPDDLTEEQYLKQLVDAGLRKRYGDPIPAAAQTAAPALDAPAFMPCFHGLCVMPVSGLLLTPLQPNSETVVLPIEIAPAARKRSTCRWSKSGMRLRWMCDPLMVRTPRVNARSLMLVGTPCRTHSGRPRITASSASIAVFIAASNVGVQIALSRGLRASARAIVSRMTSTGETAFSLIMRAKSVAGMKQSSWLMIFRSRFDAIAEYDPGRCAFIPIQGACSCATVQALIVPNRRQKFFHQNSSTMRIE
jgi:hypothetical protein